MAVAEPTERPVRLRHRVEAGALATCETLAGVMPTALWANMAAVLGIACSRMAPVRRRDLRESLNIAFGDAIDESERRRLEHEAYKNLAMLTAETMALARRGPEWVDALVTDAPGLETMRELCEAGRAPITVTGHFGNWELMGAFVALKLKSATLAKPLHNALVQERVATNRARFELNVLWTDRDDLPKAILRELRGNSIVNFLADQDMRIEGVFVDFFGRPASTTPAPALFALRTGKPLLPSFLVRTGVTSHRFITAEPIEPSTAVGDTRDEKILDLTQRHVRALEDMIRLHPAQYFWFHRRWKTTPEAAAKRKETLAQRRSRALGGEPD